MIEPTNKTTGVRTADMPKKTASATRASLVALIKRTNQTSVRITARG
jgi:hypothetical protein